MAKTLTFDCPYYFDPPAQADGTPYRYFALSFDLQDGENEYPQVRVIMAKDEKAAEAIQEERINEYNENDYPLADDGRIEEITWIEYLVLDRYK